MDVRHGARSFAQELQDLLDSTVPTLGPAHDAQRRVQVAGYEASGRFEITVAQPKRLVPLTKDGVHVADLRLRYQCSSDSARTYLAVERSEFELRVKDERMPVARLDFLRAAHSVPGAHWNIHAESGAVSHLLGRTNPGHSGKLSALHFPVGGARMRPCLEDFLAFVVFEFALDTVAGADEVIATGRERWRRRQIAALVRDAPDEATRVLTELGYEVRQPATGARTPNTTALRAW